jgi:protein PhnA
MALQKHPKLILFLNSVIADGDPEKDSETAQHHASTLSDSDLLALLQEVRSLRESGVADLTDFGTEANRWFTDSKEASVWLKMIEVAFEGASNRDEVRVALDCNGTPLNEEDSVTVIKDLKVKGGSSDLKRGTLIRKIRLTPDPKLIECRVDGSVLVLKTEFLKKA